MPYRVSLIQAYRSFANANGLINVYGKYYIYLKYSTQLMDIIKIIYSEILFLKAKISISYILGIGTF